MSYFPILKRMQNKAVMYVGAPVNVKFQIVTELFYCELSKTNYTAKPKTSFHLYLFSNAINILICKVANI